MHVVLDARTLDDHFPGIGRYTFHLAEALNHRDDIRLTLLVNPHARDSRFAPPHQAFPNARVLPVPLSPFNILSQWTIPRLLKRLQADVYHSPYYILPYAVSVPIVVTLHDTIPTRFPQYFPRGKGRLIRGLKTLAIRRAAHLLVDSQATARDIIGFYRVSPSQITVAPLAPGPQFCPQPRARTDAVRERYTLPERYFLYVGSAKPHKNVGLLMQAWASLAERWQKEAPVLALVGPIEQTALGRGMAHVAPHVQTIGFVPEEDLPALYTGARAFLFPSLYEGFGLPVLEAMACGTPVICSDIPVLVEVAGDAGWYLPPQDVDRWCRAVETLWQDEQERQRRAEQCLKRASQFSWEQTASIVVQAYHKATRTQAR